MPIQIEAFIERKKKLKRFAAVKCVKDLHYNYSFLVE